LVAVAPLLHRHRLPLDYHAPLFTAAIQGYQNIVMRLIADIPVDHPVMLEYWKVQAVPLARHMITACMRHVWKFTFRLLHIVESCQRFALHACQCRMYLVSDKRLSLERPYVLPRIRFYLPRSVQRHNFLMFSVCLTLGLLLFLSLAWQALTLDGF
jgi:hypothetical protein